MPKFEPVGFPVRLPFDVTAAVEATFWGDRMCLDMFLLVFFVVVIGYYAMVAGF